MVAAYNTRSATNTNTNTNTKTIATTMSTTNNRQTNRRRCASSVLTLTHRRPASLSAALMLTLQVLLFAGIASIAVQTSAAKHLSLSADTLHAESGGGGGGSASDIASFERMQHYAHTHTHVGHHQRRRLQRDSRSKESVQQQCDGVKAYFESIDIKLNGIYNEKGAICGGNCCTNATEHELRQKATTEFERLLHHHTKSLRGILESTATLFQSHVLELAEQSENKTLNVFSQVYRRMVPLSRQLIHQLYSEIMSHLKYTSNYSSNNNNNNNINGNGNMNNNNNLGNNNNNNNNGIGIGNGNSNANSNLESAIHKFFENLFPVAYHQAVHLSKDNYGELHEDYINCLKHNFDDLQPFGSIPKEIKTNLLQSVHTATIFMNALLQSAEVLSETDELYAMYLTDTCKKQLLKMSYCPSCNGHQRGQVKVCYSYCMNVLRGCSAQYAGLLDSPWSNVVDALDNLVTQHIHADSGIVTSIKQLDGKLSETIMRAMENGPELEKKVKKTCGTPKLLPSLAVEMEPRPMSQTNIKWATPPDADILRFLATIDKSKDFYANIVNNVCEDEDIQRNDHHCWTGERVGDYTQLVMTTGADTQRYNPEVPLETNAQTTKLNELMDTLIKIRKSIGGAAPSTVRLYSDIQADMGHQEEEGSGHIVDDDEEYGGMHGSGDGSGDDATPPAFDTAGATNVPTNNDIESRSKGSASAGSTPLLLTLVTLVTIYLSSGRGSSCIS